MRRETTEAMYRMRNESMRRVHEDEEARKKHDAEQKRQSREAAQRQRVEEYQDAVRRRKEKESQHARERPGYDDDDSDSDDEKKKHNRKTTPSSDVKPKKRPNKPKSKSKGYDSSSPSSSSSSSSSDEDTVGPLPVHKSVSNKKDKKTPPVKGGSGPSFEPSEPSDNEDDDDMSTKSHSTISTRFSHLTLSAARRLDQKRERTSHVTDQLHSEYTELLRDLGRGSLEITCQRIDKVILEEGVKYTLTALASLMAAANTLVKDHKIVIDLGSKNEHEVGLAFYDEVLRLLGLLTQFPPNLIWDMIMSNYSTSRIQELVRGKELELAVSELENQAILNQITLPPSKDEYTYIAQLQVEKQHDAKLDVIKMEYRAGVLGKQEWKTARDKIVTKCEKALKKGKDAAIAEFFSDKAEYNETLQLQAQAKTQNTANEVKKRKIRGQLDLAQGCDTVLRSFNVKIKTFLQSSSNDSVKRVLARLSSNVRHPHHPDQELSDPILGNSNAGIRI
jgi:hypothetical protein